MENSFLRKLTEITEAHISDPGFGVDELAKELNMSYSSLWRRVSKYTGKSANQLIKEIRLTRAMEILRDEDVPVSQAAYRTGFSSPNYFSTCFQDFFGFSPGELKKVARTEDNPDSDIEVAKQQSEIQLPVFLKKLRGIANPQRIWVSLITTVFFVAIAFISINMIWDKKISIAVLYPENLEQNPENLSFCGSFQEQLITDLHNHSDLIVRSRISGDRFKGKQMSMRKIGRKLRADYVINCDINNDNDYIFIRVHLLNTREDNTVWSDYYERRVESQFDLHDEIAQLVVWNVKDKLFPAEQPSPTLFKKYNEDAEIFLSKGKFHSTPGKFDFNEAFNNFSNAIKIDSSYAEAYLGMAKVLNHRYSDIETRHDTIISSCLMVLKKAEEIDRQLPGIHNERGIAYCLSHNFEGALKEFNTELKLHPDFNEALINRAKAYMSLGLWIKAENSLLELKGRDGFEQGMNYFFGYFNELQRKFDDAADGYDWACSKLSENEKSIFGIIETGIKSGLAPIEARSLLDSLRQRGGIYWTDTLRIKYEFAMLDIYQGSYTDAVSRFDSWTRTAPVSPPFYFRPKYLVQAWALSYANNNSRAAEHYISAVNFMNNLMNSSECIKTEPRATSALGLAYAGLGQRDKAIECAGTTIKLLEQNPDAWMGPYAMEDVANIFAKTGNFKKAFEILENLLSKPGPLSTKLLELDPKWDALKNLPEFQELLIKHQITGEN